MHGRACDEMSHSGVGCRDPPALLPAPSTSCRRASAPRPVHSRSALRRLDLHAFGGRRAALLLRSRRRSCTAPARQGPVALLDVTEDTFEAEVLQVSASCHLLLSCTCCCLGLRVQHNNTSCKNTCRSINTLPCQAERQGLATRAGACIVLTALRQRALVLCVPDLGCCLRRQTGPCWWTFGQPGAGRANSLRLCCPRSRRCRPSHLLLSQPVRAFSAPNC